MARAKRLDQLPIARRRVRCAVAGETQLAPCEGGRQRHHQSVDLWTAGVRDAPVRLGACRVERRRFLERSDRGAVVDAVEESETLAHYFTAVNFLETRSAHGRLILHLRRRPRSSPGRQATGCRGQTSCLRPSHPSDAKSAFLTEKVVTPMKIRFPASLLVLPISITAMFAAALRGGCDVTMTAQIRITRGPAASQDKSASAPETETAHIMFKGKMARLESADGAVRIYDGAKGRIYTLALVDKTYQVAAIKDAWKSISPLLGLSAGADFDARLKLTKTDATQTEAGRSAQKYEFVGSAEPPAPEIPYERPAGGRSRGGGRRGRGGFPGGGFRGGALDAPPQAGGYSVGEAGQSRPGPGGRSRAQASVNVAGELYLVGSALLPAGNQWVVGALVETMVPRSPLLKPTIDRLNRMKMIPLAGNLTFNFQNPGAVQDSVTIETHVETVSEAAIDDGLFEVPSDYHMSSAR